MNKMYYTQTEITKRINVTSSVQQYAVIKCKLNLQHN